MCENQQPSNYSRRRRTYALSARLSDNASVSHIISSRICVDVDAHLCTLRSEPHETITSATIRADGSSKKWLLCGIGQNMSLHSFTSFRRYISLIPSLVFAAGLCLSVPVARAQAPAVDVVIDPSAAETCVALFSVMAYTQADDDLKERLLEEKKALARADIRPQPEAVSASPDPSALQAADAQAIEPSSAPLPSSQDRIQHTMDVLTEMMLSAPAQAQGIARQCFHKYPPEIEWN